MEKNKKTIKKFRICPSCLYFLLEKWLKEMSKKGWHVFDCKVCVYYFEKGMPQEKEYFVYDAGWIGEGRYSIPSRYPLLTQTYGVKKEKSKLNKNSINKHNTIIEVDTKKIDIKNDTGYKELKRDRNRLYALLTIRNICFILGLVIILIFININR